jgi:glycosyltransferase involved in cell wall biosynthesis
MKISIVTPSFNQCRFLRETIDSVLSQEGDFQLEMLVMDGGSTDGTVALLQSSEDPRLAWVSEPDRGQTDALCKGFVRASGDVIGWLNSDDRYTPGALAAVAAGFAQHPDAHWLVGRCRIIDAQGAEIQRWITRYKDRRLRRYSFPQLLRENFICQMSVFWRRDFGRQVGDPDVSLHHAMDYDLWLRMARVADPLIVHRVLSEFRWHGGSKTNTVTRERFREHCRVARRYGHGHPWSLLLNRWHAEKTILAYNLLWQLGLLGRDRSAGELPYSAPPPPG